MRYQIQTYESLIKTNTLLIYILWLYVLTIKYYHNDLDPLSLYTLSSRLRVLYVVRHLHLDNYLGNNLAYRSHLSTLKMPWRSLARFSATLLRSNQVKLLRSMSRSIHRSQVVESLRAIYNYKQTFSINYWRGFLCMSIAYACTFHDSYIFLVNLLILWSLSGFWHSVVLSSFIRTKWTYITSLSIISVFIWIYKDILLY